VLLGTSANPVFVANAWQHMEAKFFIDAAAGTVTVRREGVTVLTVGPVRTSTDIAGSVASVQNVCLFNLGGYGQPMANGYTSRISAFGMAAAPGTTISLARASSSGCGRTVTWFSRGRHQPASPGGTGSMSNAPTDDASYIYAPDPCAGGKPFHARRFGDYRYVRGVRAGGTPLAQNRWRRRQYPAWVEIGATTGSARIDRLPRRTPTIRIFSTAIRTAAVHGRSQPSMRFSFQLNRTL
jgi:hypothetical protein